MWFVISFSKGSFQPRNWTCISCITGRLFFFLPLSNQGSPFSFYSVLVIFHSFHFIRIAMGMSVPLILITGWTLLHVQEFYVSLLTRINTQVAREVSEVEKVLTRSISDGLTATIPFFMLPRLWCTTTCV